MSGQFDRFAWHRQFCGVNMPGAAARVAMALFDRVNRAGQCWPGIDTLAADTCLSRDSVRIGINWLEHNGFAERGDRGGRSWDGQTRSTRYRLTFRTLSIPTGVGIDSALNPEKTPPQSRKNAASIPNPQAPNRPENRTENNKTVGKGRAKATYLPDDWSPAPEVVAQMRAELPHIDQDAELKAFRDHWHSTTKNPLKRNWTAAYRNWIRNAPKYARNGQPTRRSTSDALVAQTQALKHQPPPQLELQ
jgi:hypothetical protein